MPNPNQKVRQLEVESTVYDIRLPEDHPTVDAVTSVGFGENQSGSATGTTKYLHKSTDTVAADDHTHAVSGNVDLELANTPASPAATDIIIIVPAGTNWWNATDGELSLVTKKLTGSFSNGAAAATTDTATTVITNVEKNATEVTGSNDISIIDEVTYTAPVIETDTATVYEEDNN